MRSAKHGAILASTLLLSFLASACEPVRSRPLHPVGAGGLVPTRSDPDAGLVASAAGFDLKRYRVIEVARFAVVDSPAWGREDEQIAAAVTGFFRSDLVQRLRASRLFDQVIDLGASGPVDSPDVLRLEGSITGMELDYFAPSRYWRWIGPGSVQVEMRLVDVARGAVVLGTADRRTARYVTSAARDVPGTQARLEEVFSYLAKDLVRFLVRLAASALPRRAPSCCA